MKSLLVSLFTAVLVVVILRMDVTPWRIVNKAELAKQTASAQTGEPRVIERRVIVPVQPSADHSGAWMHDPNYRSALEKTTVAGHPENAKPRDPNKATPSPFGK